MPDGRSLPAGSAPFRIRGDRSDDLTAYNRWLAGQLPGRQTQMGDVQGLIMQNLQNPLGDKSYAGMYLPYFQKAAQAAAEPGLRQFGRTQARTSANIASRFGGNVSGEEMRRLRGNEELFSDAFARAMAQVGPQALALGQNATGQAMGFRGQLGAEYMGMQEGLGGGISSQEEKVPWWQRLAAAGVGAGVGYLTKSPGAGFGAYNALSN